MCDASEHILSKTKTQSTLVSSHQRCVVAIHLIFMPYFLTLAVASLISVLKNGSYTDREVTN